MPTNSNLNKIFVYVPSAEVAGFKTGAGLTNAYKGKISFLAGTGEIMTNGEIFAMNRDFKMSGIKYHIPNNLKMPDYIKLLEENINE
jgi:hypothetical protein